MLSRSTPSPSPPDAESPSANPQISGEGKAVPSTPESPPENDGPPENQAAAGRNPGFPNREDCWSEEATRTLIDAWGSHYLQLNRGNLRQKHWQAVADVVNARHGATVKLRRTDVQCKNRIDTTKKKYKIEKSKVGQSNGRYVSTWPHFQSLDSFIGSSSTKPNGGHGYGNGHTGKLRRRDSSSSEKSSSPSTATRRGPKSPISNHRGKDPAAARLPQWSVPVGPRSKRAGPGIVTERNFSVMAAAAAAMETEEDDEYDEDDEEEWRRPHPPQPRPPSGQGTKRANSSQKEGALIGEGYAKLAEAISKLAQIYENVEEAKQRQMVELEKQRIQFAKDVELQRMQMFVESQVRLEKLKRTKPNS